MINMQDVLYFNKANPQHDVWLADSDVVIIPKGILLKADELVDLRVHARPVSGAARRATLNFNKQATL